MRILVGLSKEVLAKVECGLGMEDYGAVGLDDGELKSLWQDCMEYGNGLVTSEPQNTSFSSALSSFPSDVINFQNTVTLLPVFGEVCVPTP